MHAPNRQAIAALNDAFRRTLPFGGGVPGRTVMTRGIAALPSRTVADILMAVRRFNTFTPDNDPHLEHDFGTVTIAGEKCFWKIDYYETDACEFGCDDAADVAASYRVLTVMLASEY
jgi:hypothetical protein